ncbi:MAG: hypothetical protein KGO96_01820 [Elusimicrobia bacterium]|nr:hypothetical protein [Elusimicrobiota bacterium]MDE2237695.1 hypothetical protein [Elusimicrobiota bacterium]MDE2424633.1 hypothetical protein [Elusimicrobiota bacterium]
MKNAPKKEKASRKHRRERPLEFARGWQELEAQADRLKCDWASLAAQLGIGGSRARF